MAVRFKSGTQSISRCTARDLLTGLGRLQFLHSEKTQSVLATSGADFDVRRAHRRNSALVRIRAVFATCDGDGTVISLCT